MIKPAIIRLKIIQINHFAFFPVLVGLFLPSTLHLPPYFMNLPLPNGTMEFINGYLMSGWVMGMTFQKQRSLLLLFQLVRPI